MFIGEAPGECEDSLGIPFIGPSGLILRHTFSYVKTPFSYLITNTVCCRPQTVIYLSTEADTQALDDPESALENLIEGEDYEIYDHNREPTPQEIAACKPHIDELMVDFRPDGIVYLGKVGTTYKSRLPTLSLLHPAYIARLECKLQSVRSEAEKLSSFIKNLK